MPSTVHLALLDTLADWEVGYLTAHLGSLDGGATSSGFALRTVSVDGAPVTTMGGLRVVADLALADLDPATSSALVLPGAHVWHDAEAAAPFVGAARRHLAAGVPVAAICGATFALAAAGLLDARPHTSNDPGYLASSGYAGSGHYVTDEPVVVDGDLVTASGVAPVPFARAVFARLGAHPEARLRSYATLYEHHDPAGFFELVSA